MRACAGMRRWLVQPLVSSARRIMCWFAKQITPAGSRVSEISACYIDLDPLSACVSLCDLRRRGCESRVRRIYVDRARARCISHSLTRSAIRLIALWSVVRFD